MTEKQNFKNISILGAGAWGTALAEVMSRQGHQINLWAKESAVVSSINSSHAVSYTHLTLPTKA